MKKSMPKRTLISEMSKLMIAKGYAADKEEAKTILDNNHCCSWNSIEDFLIQHINGSPVFYGFEISMLPWIDLEKMKHDLFYGEKAIYFSIDSFQAEKQIDVYRRELKK